MIWDAIALIMTSSQCDYLSMSGLKIILMSKRDPKSPFCWHTLTFIPALIRNHMYSKVWGGLLTPLKFVNGRFHIILYDGCITYLYLGSRRSFRMMVLSNKTDSKSLIAEETLATIIFVNLPYVCLRSNPVKFSDKSRYAEISCFVYVRKRQLMN